MSKIRKKPIQKKHDPYLGEPKKPVIEGGLASHVTDRKLIETKPIKPVIEGGLASHITDRKLIETKPIAEDFDKIKDYGKAKAEYAETGTYTKWGQDVQPVQTVTPVLGGLPKVDTMQDANKLINQKQDEFFQEEEKKVAPPARGGQYDKVIQKQIDSLSDLQQPAQPSAMESQYDSLRDERGVDSLETELNTLKSEEENLVARTRERTKAQESKHVAMGVIAGRVGEIERQEAERIDSIRRRKQTLTDQLNTQYQVIDQMMQFSQVDYNNARQNYNDNFSQSMQMINLLKGFKTDEESKKFREKQFSQNVRQFDVGQEWKERIFDEQQKDREQDVARANLQIVSNNIIEGNIRLDQMDEDQKLMVTKLEAQAGLPSGTMKLLKSKYPDSKIIANYARTDKYGNKYADFIFRDDNGQLRVENMKLGEGASGNEYIHKSTRTDPDGTSYLDIVEMNPVTGNIETKSIPLGDVKSKKIYGTTGISNLTSQEGQNALAFIDQALSNIGKKGGQCGYFGNNYLQKLGAGRPFLDSEKSKLDTINVNVNDFMKTPVDGAMALYNIKTGQAADNGHVGVVRVDAAGQLWLVDSNGDGVSERIDVRKLDLDKGLERNIVGFYVPDALQVPQFGDSSKVNTEAINNFFNILDKTPDSGLNDLINKFNFNQDEKAEILRRHNQRLQEAQTAEQYNKQVDILNTALQVGQPKATPYEKKTIPNTQLKKPKQSKNDDNEYGFFGGDTGGSSTGGGGYLNEYE